MTFELLATNKDRPEYLPRHLCALFNPVITSLCDFTCAHYRLFYRLFENITRFLACQKELKKTQGKNIVTQLKIGIWIYV